MLTAVAKALKLTEAQLQTQLRSGKTLAQIAKAQGVSEAQLYTAAVNALKTHLAIEVKAGKLTQAQADDLLKRAQADAQFGLKFGRGDHDPDGKGEGAGKRHHEHGHGGPHGEGPHGDGPQQRPAPKQNGKS